MALVLHRIALVCALIGLLMTAACSSNPVVGPSLAAVAESESSDNAPDQLTSCPSSPNCVSSVTSDAEKLVHPFELAGADAEDYQAQLVAAIESDGGRVKDTRKGYVWATYTSSVFRFVDDIEWLYDAANNQFNVRSASRTGYSDLGVNAKRVERLRALMK